MTDFSKNARAHTESGANRGETHLADAEERRRALHPSVSFHLEAPAGSGKTFLLTARYLRLLGIVKHPGQILAMTFTNKAAAEMQQRVLSRLESASNSAPPKDDLEAEMRELARQAMGRHRQRWELIRSGGALRIQTFHSFCYGLVTQSPLEAGIAPGATLLGELDQTIFMRDAIKQTLDAIMKRAPSDAYRQALENRLLFLNNSWPHLVQELEDLLGRRELLGDLIQVMDRQRTEDYVLDGIRSMVEADLRILRRGFECSSLGTAWGNFLEDLASHGADAVNVLPTDIPSTEWESGLASWQNMASILLTKDGGVRKQVGPKTGFYSGFSKSEHFGRMQDLDASAVAALGRIRALPAPGAALPDMESLWDLVLLLHALMEAYEEKRRRHRVLDFCALEIAALRLLDQMEPSDLQLLLDQQLQHLLVDEFQDTNRQQWLLLQRLCAEWTPGDGRSLFVVGDPKQSIYGFRKAEVRLFLEAREGLPVDAFHRVPVESLVLRTNFRSRGTLIEWCNEVFSETVMSDPRPDLDEVPFTSAVCSPGNDPGAEHQPIELALFGAIPDARTARQREAAWIASRIASECGQSRDGEESTGILLYARTHLPVYLDALYRYGIPVQVSEGLKLLERPEVEFLWQLCRALALPHDDLAWAAQLRSPWLMLDYDGLLSVSERGHGGWIERIRESTLESGKISVFWESLREARRHIGHEPLADVVEDAWLALGGAKAAGALWGSRGIASCRRFLELAHEAEVNDPVATVERLRQLLDDAYEPVDPETSHSNVFIMTVHRAKGLEFDTVYLPFMDWNPIARERTAPPPYLLEQTPGATDRRLLAVRPDRRREGSDPIYERLRDLHLSRRWGEAKRLFYVAATRARGRLRMSAVLPCDKNGKTMWRSRAPVGWLNEHYGLAEAAALNGCVSSQDSAGEKTWTDKNGRFQVVLEPEATLPQVAVTPGGGREVALQPALFERERSALRVKSPSSVEVGEFGAEGLPAGERPGLSLTWENHRLWGVLVHYLLECWGTRKMAPSVKSLCGFLASQGAGEEEAARMAEAALGEVSACVKDPWLEEIYNLPGGRRRIEWSVEGSLAPGSVHVGVVDLAAFDGARWRLIDFKTSRPGMGEDADDFFRREIRTYRSQLETYREMTSMAFGVARESVEAWLYWTALRERRAVE